MEPSSKSTHYWSEEETEFMLAKLKECNIIRCMDGRKKRNGALFRRVSSALAEAGFGRTPEQVRVRWKHMKTLYFGVQRHNRQNGQARKSCPHFHILDDLLGDLNPAQAGHPGEGELGGTAAEPGEDMPELSSLESEDEADATLSRRSHQPTEANSPNCPSAESTPRKRAQSPNVDHCLDQMERENPEHQRQNMENMEHKERPRENPVQLPANTDNLPTAVASSSKSSHYWSEEETEFMLAKLKECNIIRCMDGRKRRNGALFKRVSGALAEAGFGRTPEQVRVRWKNMKSLYFSVQRHNRQNGQARKSCPHSHILDDLLGDLSPAQAGHPGEGELGGTAAEPGENVPELSSLESEDEADATPSGRSHQPTEASSPDCPSAESPPRKRVSSPNVDHLFDRTERRSSKHHRQNTENTENTENQESTEQLKRLMSKLNALGFQPVLFTAKTSRTGQTKGDLIHFLQPERSSAEIIQNMHRLYESLIKGPPSSPSIKSETKAELLSPPDADASAVPAPTPQFLFPSPSAAPATPQSVGSAPAPALTPYYIIPAPQPPGAAPGAALTPYYVIPAPPPTGPTPVPAPTSFYFIPAPQPAASASPVPAPTPYYLIPSLRPPGAAPAPASAPTSFMVPAPQDERPRAADAGALPAHTDCPLSEDSLGDFCVISLE